MLQTGAEQAASYNALLPIADAQRAFQKRGGNLAVDTLLSIVADAGAEAVVGIRLLHKHNDISAGEIMLERNEVDDEGFALITSAVPCDVRPAVCNSWQITERGLVPIEFSQPGIVVAQFDMREHEDLFCRLSDAIIALGVEDILGPSLNYGAYVEAFAPSSGAAFLEKTDFENRANVVRYVNRSDAEFTNSAKTKWHAKRIVDSTGKATWMTACNCFCSVFPEGGHQGTTTHSYSNGDEEKESE